jgi:hypothetical protein
MKAAFVAFFALLGDVRINSYPQELIAKMVDALRLSTLLTSPISLKIFLIDELYLMVKFCKI